MRDEPSPIDPVTPATHNHNSFERVPFIAPIDTIREAFTYIADCMQGGPINARRFRQAIWIVEQVADERLYSQRSDEGG